MAITTNTFTVGGVAFEGTDIVQSQVDHINSQNNSVGLEGAGPAASFSWNPTPNPTINLSLDLTSQTDILNLTSIQLINVELRGCLNNG